MDLFTHPTDNRNKFGVRFTLDDTCWLNDFVASREATVSDVMRVAFQYARDAGVLERTFHFRQTMDDEPTPVDPQPPTLF